MAAAQLAQTGTENSTVTTTNCSICRGKCIKKREAINRALGKSISYRDIEAMTNSLLRQLQLTKRYKRGENPAFDAKLEAANIEQPDFEPDKKIRPTYWDYKTGRKMTFDENGATVPVLTSDGKEITADSQKEVDSGGYTVMPGMARTVEGQIESSQVNAGNDTARNEIEYKVIIAKLNSRISSSSTRISQIQKRLGEIEELPPSKHTTVAE